MEALELGLEFLIEFAVLALEWAGVLILLVASIRAVVNYICRVPETKLRLAHGLGMSLEVLMGSEILHTIEMRTLDDAAVLAALIVMRVALAIFTHWEATQEDHHLREHAKEIIEAHDEHMAEKVVEKIAETFPAKGQDKPAETEPVPDAAPAAPQAEEIPAEEAAVVPAAEAPVPAAEEPVPTAEEPAVPAEKKTPAKKSTSTKKSSSGTKKSTSSTAKKSTAAAKKAPAAGKNAAK